MKSPHRRETRKVRLGRLLNRRSKVGEVPGQIPTGRENASLAIRVIQYSETTHKEDVLTLRDDVVREFKRIASTISASPQPSPEGSSNVVWINVNNAQNTSILHSISEVFGIHPLAMEDVSNVHQRVKCEKYGDTLFFVARMPYKSERFETEQIGIFLQRQLVITFHERPGDCLDSVRGRIQNSTGRIRQRHADYLVYSIIDRIIDEFFPLMEVFDENLGELFGLIEASQHQDLPHRLHYIRDDLLQVRKTSSQYRTALKRFLQDGGGLLADDMEYFIRDCQDHITQLLEASDLGRESCGELRELHFALMGQKSNDISKFLTLIATVFIPMSFISGVYGMNFDSSVSAANMPELHWAFGYPFALSLMLLTGGGLLAYLYRRGWLS